MGYVENEDKDACILGLYRRYMATIGLRCTAIASSMMRKADGCVVISFRTTFRPTNPLQIHTGFFC